MATLNRQNAAVKFSISCDEMNNTKNSFSFILGWNALDARVNLKSIKLDHILLPILPNARKIDATPIFTKFWLYHAFSYVKIHIFLYLW